jgi:uncharacterized protein (TIGR00369 family)
MDTGPHSFEMDSWISCAPFEKLLNMEIVKAENGKAVLKMPFLLEYAQGAALMHGGALVALADTAVVMAIKSILEPNSHFATIKLESEFLYPVKKGIVTAYAEVSKGNNERIFLGKSEIFNEEQKKVMQFSSTFKLAKSAAITNVKFNNP